MTAADEFGYNIAQSTATVDDNNRLIDETSIKSTSLGLPKIYV
ncbi:hypothetical protein [Mycoplasmopsis bovis]